MALCISDLYRSSSRKRKPTEKKTNVGFVLRIIGILGIFAGVTIHAADNVQVAGHLYIVGAIVYIIGRFLFGFPIIDNVATPICVPDTISELSNNEENATAPVVAPNTTQLKEASNENTAKTIRDFKKLFDDGIITQEEYDAKKKQLLGL